MSIIEEIIPSSYSAYSNKNSSKQQKKVNHVEEVERKDEPFNQEKFWRIIEVLSWKNSDEQKMSKNEIKRVLSVEEITYLKNHINEIASHVEEATRPLGWYTNTDDITIKNFTYHIVALGYQYYLSALSDPTFIQFIWDAHPKIYQNLYDMIVII
jgi:hypothetical protein